jgi:hypothetical protein
MRTSQNAQKAKFAEFTSVLKNSSTPPWSPDQGLKDPFTQCFGLGLAVLDSLLICQPARERLFQQAVTFHALGVNHEAASWNSSGIHRRMFS